MPKVIFINGENLNVEDIWEIANNNAKVEIDLAKKEEIEKARRFVDQTCEQKLTYGVNTGFGPMANYILSHDQLEKLQENLILSHAVGMGDSLTVAEVTAVMVVRLNTLVKGYSGVSWNLIEKLKNYINSGIVPIVPKHGSVGASGDLVQLAHIALALIGKGKVRYKNEIRQTSTVLSELGLEPIKLLPKEGLSLINGTSTMSGLAALLIYEAEKIFSYSLSFGSWAYELMEGYSDAYSNKIAKVREHPGQVEVIARMKNILIDSQLIQNRQELIDKTELNNGDTIKIDHKVQDVYSLRCLPQVLGPVLDTIKNAKQVVLTEINSVTDNPILDINTDRYVHGGNFHGDYISLEMDKLKIVMARLALLAERQINSFLNDNLDNNFPPFLNLRKPGFDLALQGLQFVATSTAAEIQTLAFPNYVHSITTNADNQDIVSMGTNSALFAKQAIDGVYHILTVLYITLAQAVDVRTNEDSLSSATLRLYQEIRTVFPAITDDRYLDDDLDKLMKAMRKTIQITN